jgi:hypothetical protein
MRTEKTIFSTFGYALSECHDGAADDTMARSGSVAQW